MNVDLRNLSISAESENDEFIDVETVSVKGEEPSEEDIYVDVVGMDDEPSQNGAGSEIESGPPTKQIWGAPVSFRFGALENVEGDKYEEFMAKLKQVKNPSRLEVQGSFKKHLNAVVMALKAIPVEHLIFRTTCSSLADLGLLVLNLLYFKIEKSLRLAVIIDEPLSSILTRATHYVENLLKLECKIEHVCLLSSEWFDHLPYRGPPVKPEDFMTAARAYELSNRSYNVLVEPHVINLEVIEGRINSIGA
ncbi:hypothetical protein L596_012153 [Steinernema carpocapsae]|uniref:Uncharacterized protein n=1 Tax=Steinernema carpocapsae TaxID=34508 RepID=A0A4U5NWK3_STECR|nr:hypothetical protein L596_012153 [Steinernema carpocapsae]